MIGATVGERESAISPQIRHSLPAASPSPQPRAEYFTGTVHSLRQRYHVWFQLAKQCGADPSLHPDSQLAFLEAMQPTASVAMVNVARKGTYIGVLPLVSDRADMVHVPVRRLRSPGLVDSPDRFDILCAPGESAGVVRSIWTTLAARNDWDVIELVDLPEGGPGWQLLDLARSQGFGVGHRISRLTPYLSLNPELTLEANLPATSAKFRANLRRRRRNLEKLGPVKLIRRTCWDSALFMQFLDLEHAGWKGTNGTSILSDPVETAYYRRLGKALAASGMLVMYSLECAGEPIAMHFGTVVAGRYAVPKLAFSERHHEFAPGQLLVWAVLEDLLERGFTEFDFLGDAKPWKQEWTDQIRIHHRAHIFNKTIAGRLAKAARYDVAPRGKLLKARLARNAAGMSSRFGSQTRELHG